MITKNPMELKERIVQFLNLRGPMLPIYISKEINLETLFTSAFLSELVSEKRINVSYMRVGSSPIYFTEEKRQNLENYGQYLGNKEKEAFLALKEKTFLVDEEQEPAIRVALRQIKDFAIPFHINDKIIWRYFTIQEKDFEEIEKPKEISLEPPKKIIEIKEKINEEIEKPKKQAKTKKVVQKRKTKPKENDKKNDKFLEKIKEFLSTKNTEIISIERANKNELILKIKENNSENLLIAYNKKKVIELDIIKAHKKAKELNLNYKIMSLGEPSKKMISLIDALKDLSSIESLK